MNTKKYADDLEREWPAAHVPRTKTLAFTGGAVSDRTVANKESADHANRVPGRFVLGARIMYPVREYAEWIAEMFLKQPDGNGSDISDCSPSNE